MRLLMPQPAPTDQLQIAVLLLLYAAVCGGRHLLPAACLRAHLPTLMAR
jgi:hypothetical protein